MTHFHSPSLKRGASAPSECLSCKAISTNNARTRDTLITRVSINATLILYCTEIRFGHHQGKSDGSSFLSCMCFALFLLLSLVSGLAQSLSAYNWLLTCLLACRKNQAHTQGWVGRSVGVPPLLQPLEAKHEKRRKLLSRSRDDDEGDG